MKNEIYPNKLCNGYGVHCDGCTNCKPERATTASASPTTVRVPEPLLYYRADEHGDIVWGEDCVCVDDVYSSGNFAEAEEVGQRACKAFSETQMQAYGDARAEEARREAADALEIVALDRDEWMAKAQRTAGGDAAQCKLCDSELGTAHHGDCFLRAERIVSESSVYRPVAEAAAQAPASDSIHPTPELMRAVRPHLVAAVQAARKLFVRNALRNGDWCPPIQGAADHANNFARDFNLAQVAEAAAQADDEAAYATSGYRHFMSLDTFKAFRAECANRAKAMPEIDAAPTAQPTPPDDERAKLEEMANELEDAAQPYEGDFADVVRHHIEALRALAAKQAGKGE